MSKLTALIDNINQKTSTLYSVEYEMEVWWKDVTDAVVELNHGGWSGKGADAFFAHLHGPMDKQIKDTIQNVGILRKKLDEALKYVEAADTLMTPVNAVEEVIDSIGAWL